MQTLLFLRHIGRISAEDLFFVLAFSKNFVASSLPDIPHALLVCCELACNKESVHKTRKPVKVFLLNRCFCLSDPDSTVPEKLYFK